MLDVTPGTVYVTIAYRETGGVGSLGGTAYFSKDYDSIPCDKFDEESITFVNDASGSDCTFSSATVKLTAI